MIKVTPEMAENQIGQSVYDIASRWGLQDYVKPFFDHASRCYVVEVKYIGLRLGNFKYNDVIFNSTESLISPIAQSSIRGRLMDFLKSEDYQDFKLHIMIDSINAQI